MTAFDPARHCGGKTRGGGRCMRPKGWGTSHPGYGSCKWHTGATENGRKAAAKERTMVLARGMLGAMLPGSPLDAMQEAVDASRGLLAYYHRELGKAYEADDHARVASLRAEYADAIKLEKDVAHGAVVAGVAERRQALAERDSAVLAEAIAEALAEAFGELATPDRQAVFARVLGRRLEVLEGDESPPGLAA